MTGLRPESTEDPRLLVGLGEATRSAPRRPRRMSSHSSARAKPRGRRALAIDRLFADR